MTDDVATTCACCRARPSDGYRTCTRCTDRLRDSLADIAEHWPMVLVPALAPPRPVARRAPGFGSRVPIDVGRIAITTPTLVATNPGDLHYPPAIVCGWAEIAHQELTGHPEYHGDIVAAARYLAKQLGHITRQDWVGDMWPEIRDVARQIASTVGVDTRRLIGPCPNLLGGRRCSARLYAPLAGDTIPCGRCGESYDRARWGWLGRLIGSVPA